MQAVEFEADVSNGVIKVPEYYRQTSFQQARIILLFPDLQPQEAKEETMHSKALFQSTAIETRNFKFNRDDANVR